MKRHPPWRRAAIRGVMICGSLLLFLEIGLRLFGYGSYIIYQPDQELLWLPTPGQRGRTVVGHQAISINREGFRYPTDLGKKDPEEFRIFTFGDSATMGWGVDDSSHFSAVLERLLSERRTERRVRVVSAGVNAYPRTLCIRRFARLLAEGYQIDGAILAHSFNLSHEPLARLEGKEKQQFLRKVRLKSHVRRSAIYNLVIEDLLREAVYYRIRQRLVEGSWDLDSSGSDGDNSNAAGGQGDGLNVYLAPLETMKTLGERHGVQLAFLLLGTQGQLDRLSDYQKTLLDFADRNGIPAVDIITQIKSMDHEPLFMDHVHPSPAGHELIARELLPVIEPWVEEREATRHKARSHSSTGMPSSHTGGTGARRPQVMSEEKSLPARSP